MKGQLDYFDLQDRYAQTSKSGDPLERMAHAVEFEPFRDRLNRALKRSDHGRGGRSLGLRSRADVQGADPAIIGYAFG